MAPSAGFADLLGANYWKPLRGGLGGKIGTELIARLVHRLGRLSWFSPLTAGRLQAALKASFRLDDFKP